MREAVKTVLNNIKKYYPDRVYLLVFLCAFLYIFITNKKMRKKLMLPMIVIAIIVVNPVLYKFVFHKLIYWRFFWIFSDILIISYAITDLIRKTDKAWLKLLISGFCAGIIIASGVNVFTSGALVKTQNKEHLDSHTVAVCDAMLAINDYPKCVVPLELTWEARQYSGNIQMMYGRNADGFINRVDPAGDLVQESINEGVGFDYVFTMAATHGYPFVVTLAWKQPEADIAQAYNYEKCFEDEMYALYYNQNVTTKASYDGALLIRYNINNYVFYTLDTCDAFIVIGGDDCTDEGLLRAVIRSHNNRVDVWYRLGLDEVKGEYSDIMTHPQGAEIVQTMQLKENTSYDVDDLEALFEGDNPDYYINYLMIDDVSDVLGEIVP